MSPSPAASSLSGMPGGPDVMADVLVPLADGLAGDLPPALAERLKVFATQGGCADDFQALIEDLAGHSAITSFIMMSLETIWEGMLRAEGRPVPGN